MTWSGFIRPIGKEDKRRPPLVRLFAENTIDNVIHTAAYTKTDYIRGASGPDMQDFDRYDHEEDTRYKKDLQRSTSRTTTSPQRKRRQIVEELVEWEFV
ncbi:hypothetical protein FF1_026864 [Malus domestica]